MIPLYRTSRMEDSVIALDSQYARVMVRAISIMPNPIRLRVGALEAIRPFYLRNDPAFDTEAERWKVEQGTLINYRPQGKREPVLAHDACVLCECPLSLDLIEDSARDASKVCVIYQPPSWRAHEELIFGKYPTGAAAKRFIQAVRAATPTLEYANMAKALKIPTAGTYAIADDALRDFLGTEPDSFPTLRKRAMRQIGGRRWSQVQILIPRIEPEDQTLLSFYRFIKDDLPASGNVRLARDNALVKGARFWKLALRALTRSGSVERRGTLGFYFMDGLEPDYELIQAEHAGAQARFSRLRDAVEKLPEFPLPDEAHSSQPISAPALSES